MPHSPKPPTAIVDPLATSATASVAEATTLSTTDLPPPGDPTAPPTTPCQMGVPLVTVTWWLAVPGGRLLCGTWARRQRTTATGATSACTSSRARAAPA